MVFGLGRVVRFEELDVAFPRGRLRPKTEGHNLTVNYSPTTVRVTKRVTGSFTLIRAGELQNKSPRFQFSADCGMSALLLSFNLANDLSGRIKTSPITKGVFDL